MSGLLKIADALSRLTVLEAAELSKMLKDKWVTLLFDAVSVESQAAPTSRNARASSLAAIADEIVVRSFSSTRIALTAHKPIAETAAGRSFPSKTA